MARRPVKNSSIHSIPLELGAIDETNVPSDIQIIRTGSFNHIFFGKFEITKKTLASMVKNWDTDIKETDLAIDYSHESGREAAGWIIDLHTREDGNELWAQIDWTPKGRARVAEKEFRYISADFTENYIDNETGKEFGPTLFGCALTNRPFVKGMAPAVALSEYQSPQGDNDMTAEEQLKAEQAKNKKLQENLDAEKKKAVDSEGSKELEDLKAKNKTLTDANEKREKEVATEKKKGQFDEMMKIGQVVERQREAYMADDMVKFTAEAPKAGEVILEAAGSGGDGTEGNPKPAATDDPDGKILELAQEAKKEDEKLSDADAISKVLGENPELAKKINDREEAVYG